MSGFRGFRGNEHYQGRSVNEPILNYDEDAEEVADSWGEESEDDEEFYRRMNEYQTRSRSRPRSNNSFSEGFRSGDTELSNITCRFCEPIIQFLLNFRLQEEEEPLEHIPKCFKIRDDDVYLLAARGAQCKICDMVCSAMVDLLLDSRGLNLEDDELDARDRMICWEFNHTFADPRPVLCVGGGSLSVYFKFRESLWCFLEHQPRPESEAAVRNGQISYDVLYRWYEKCLGHGGTLQDELIVSDMPSTTVRLIDTRDDCIRDVSTTEQYLALSYVWGPRSGENDKLTTENLRLLYTKGGLGSHVRCPRTVRDAIEVTQKLGFRYLFVDRLCIVQNKSEDKALYVTAMHEIYNRARITIVAAAGDNADSGLPGTSGTTRFGSALYNERRCISVTDTHDFVQVYMDEFPTSKLMEKHLKTTAWAARGWTYQEDKLSDRCLIFTDTAVFWRCGHLCLYENCPYEQNEMLSTNLQDLAANDPFGRGIFWWISRRMNNSGSNQSNIGQTSLQNRPRAQEIQAEFSDVTYVKERDLRANIAFRSCIQDFSGRRLTYQDDIANAFKGMIEAFKAIYKPLPIHHGMFTRSFPADLLWACLGCVENTHTHHAEHPGRRDCLDHTGLPCFPTWSWYAWRDPPNWEYGQRLSEGYFGEMDEPDAMTSSIYAGIGTPPVITRIYQEMRPMGWRMSERDFVPLPWMTQHRLRDRAIMFIARGFPSNWHLEGRASIGTSMRLADIGRRRCLMPDIEIVEWLQLPSSTAFEWQVNIICLSHTRSFNRRETLPLVAMMLVSLQQVDGHEVAFREGLFTCKVSDLHAALIEKRIFLC